MAQAKKDIEAAFVVCVRGVFTLNGLQVFSRVADEDINSAIASYGVNGASVLSGDVKRLAKRSKYYFGEHVFKVSGSESARALCRFFREAEKRISQDDGAMLVRRVKGERKIPLVDLKALKQRCFERMVTARSKRALAA